MFPEDIDDLFREKLEGHSSPPAGDLWARLQASTPAEPAAPAPDVNAERLDQLFQKRLSGHATAPRREVWERLEDEHLRPRKRRPAAWWPMAIAAAVALFIVAGSVGLWSGRPWSSTRSGAVATQSQPSARPSAAEQPSVLSQPETGAAQQSGLTPESATGLAAVTPDEAAEKNYSAAEKNSANQATRFVQLASSAPTARTSAPGASPRHLQDTRRQPDAAAAQAPLVAQTTPQDARPALPQSPAADESRPAQAPVLVAAAPTPTPGSEIVPAHLAPTADVITVDVRSGEASASRAARLVTSALAAADEPQERRRLGGRLLQQAGHLVRGERVSLSEVTGLPETVTVRATLGGRSLTKSIQL